MNIYDAWQIRDYKIHSNITKQHLIVYLWQDTWCIWYLGQGSGTICTPNCCCTNAVCIMMQCDQRRMLLAMKSQNMFNMHSWKKCPAEITYQLSHIIMRHYMWPLRPFDTQGRIHHNYANMIKWDTYIPPVAIKSSTITTFCPGLIASVCISIVSCNWNENRNINEILWTFVSRQTDRQTILLIHDKESQLHTIQQTFPVH